MARYPGGGQLPPIHWDDRDSPSHPRPLAGNKQVYFGSHGSPLFDDSPHSAIVSRAVLLEQDFANNLSQGQGGSVLWQERNAQAVLQDYIHTVTMAIKKISKEMEAIEEQLRNKERATELTTNSLKNLELQHVGSISDLRQRVGRCDVSIAKLSGDSRRTSESLAAINKQVQDQSIQHGKTVSDLEIKISRLETQLAKSTSDQHSQVGSIETESKHQVTLLETKTMNRLEELQRTLDTLQMKRDSDWQLMERSLTTTVESTISKRDRKQELFEQKILNRLEDMEKKLMLQEGTIRTMSDELHALLGDKIKKLEARLQQRQEALQGEVKRDLEEMGEQNESGFKRVKDSMATMRIVLEGKQQLLAENLQKQVANVKKLVVLT
ncbi:protein FAM81A-like [Acanthaster planci]|uniref:Protein FAM81A-like n=1 Tax=Acanthaster planci TaxID=133434 RepID=A0A8B7ZYR0_ACAPL|nr:protein FAM81A-like [Acanthaster planci]